MEDFKRLKELFFNVKRTKKEEKQLHKDAIEWFEKEFLATFGKELNKSHYWAFKAGLLCFTIPELGEYYHYSFAILLLHFKKYNTKEFKEGFKYGLKSIKQETKYRDGNPYKETIFFYQKMAWDCGYMNALRNG